MTTDQSKAPAPSAGDEPATDWYHGITEKHFDIAVRRAVSAALTSQPPAPIDMVLHCPKCVAQHIDAPEPFGPAVPQCMREGEWLNPPHRSHLCHSCGHIWRPADVPTNGVIEVKTRGSADSPAAQPPAVALVDETWVSVDDRLPHDPSKALVWYVPSKNSPHILFVWFSGGEWRFTDRTGDTRLSERVTHWMPLPQPPTGAQTPNADQVASSSGPLPLGITAELLEDALQVLRMVDDNHRVDAGERRKAWGGRFVVDEVRRVLTKGGA